MAKKQTQFTKSKKRVKVLSIDGGGIRGIIPAYLLGEIEKQTKKPICELFDVIAGTSTGGIIAAMLTRPDPASKGAKDRPLYNSAQVVQLYLDHGQRIFPRKFLGGSLIRAVIDDEKYDADGLEAVLKNYLGDSRLKECLGNVIIPAYDTERRSPMFFKSHKARKDPARNFMLREVARATSAAPTYFEPLKLPVAHESDLSVYYSLIDGGVFANNPAMCAYAEVLKLFPDAEEILVVSLGTGEHTRRYRWDQVKDWSTVQWLRPVLAILMDGPADSTDYQLKMLLNDGGTATGAKQNYYRFELELAGVSDEFDDVTPSNLRAILQLAEKTAKDRAKELNEVCGKLV